MSKVTASKEILGITGGTADKLNMWANIIKWIILVFAVLMALIGLAMMVNIYTRAAGLVFIFGAIINGFVSFFVVYIIRAFAIITEACAIIVAEHAEPEE